MSVSALLNLYFDELDINSIPVQRGIYRGVGLDIGIENYFNFNKFEMPNSSVILKKITNPSVREKNDELYEQSKKCYNGFKKLIDSKKLIINEVQTKISNSDIEVHGILDSLVCINNKKYIIDWKSKEKFSTYIYSEIELKKMYGDYVSWCNANNVNAKKYDLFCNNKIDLGRAYSLGHFRYCLQVCLYWLILKKPEDTELAIAYFDVEENYYIFTFDKNKCARICMDLIKYSKGTSTQKEFIKDKIKIINWQKIIDWKRINV